MKNIIKKIYKDLITSLTTAFTLGIAALVIVITTLNIVTLAATPVNLGTADSFAVLAGSTITNSGPSVINGNLGLSPGSSVTGFPPGTINGTEQVANSTAVQAQTDLITAYNNAAGQTPVSTIPTELGGTTLTTGVYDSLTGTFGITGTLTLDAAGDPSRVFIFKTASSLITQGGSNVILANGAQACNVFWQVGSSATLGTNSTFRGNILALTSATLNTGANVEGRVLTRNGAVTLDTNTITRSTCAPVSRPTTISFTTSSPTPTPTTVSTLTPTPTPTTTTPTSDSANISFTTSSPTPSFDTTPTPITTEVSTVTISPKLPNTGIAPEVSSNTSTWSVIIAASTLALISSFYLAQRKLSRISAKQN